MKKYISIIILTLFTFIYMNKVIELSDSNNTLLVAINDYSSNNSEECIEGSINSDGVTLGYPGKIVSVEDSYSNMKGTKFDENLIEYKKDKCILNKEETIDKYIISGNKHEKKMSIVIDIDGSKYYDGFDTVANNENIALNYLINVNNNSVKSDNILIKTNSNNINDFKKKYNHFYCVKYNGYEVLDYCKKEHINSINIVTCISKFFTEIIHIDVDYFWGFRIRCTPNFFKYLLARKNYIFIDHEII